MVCKICIIDIKEGRELERTSELLNPLGECIRPRFTKLPRLSNEVSRSKRKPSKANRTRKAKADHLQNVPPLPLFFSSIYFEGLPLPECFSHAHAHALRQSAKTKCQSDGALRQSAKTKCKSEVCVGITDLSTGYPQVCTQPGATFVPFYANQGAPKRTFVLFYVSKHLLSF